MWSIKISNILPEIAFDEPARLVVIYCVRLFDNCFWWVRVAAPRQRGS